MVWSPRPTTDPTDGGVHLRAGDADVIDLRASQPRIYRVADPEPQASPTADPGSRLRPSVPLLLLGVDLLCLALPVLWTPTHAKAIVVASLLTVAFLWFGELYRSRLQALVLDELPGLLGRALGAVGLVSTVSALRHQDGSLDGLIKALAESMLFLIVGRTAVTWTIRLARRRRWVRHETLIIGSGPVADRLVATLASTPTYGLHVVGRLADRPAGRAAAARAEDLGTVDDLPDVLASSGAHVVIVADAGFDELTLPRLVQQSLASGCELFVVPRLHEAGRQPSGTETIGAVPVVRLGHDLRRGWSWKGKRVFDVVATGVALVLLSPVFALCALAVRLDSGRGVLFRQVRLGGDGKPFELLKFRTLRPVDDVESATRWSVSDDARVTRVGRFLRRTSLDELPQLWNILRGEMTIVGPRPERPHFVEKFSAESPAYALRHRVPSGLTGLAQVNGMRGDTSIAERAGFDNYYIENWSLWLDVKVIVRTVVEVLAARGR